MKKKSKIILFSLIGALVLGGVGIGIVVDTLNASDDISGTIVEGKGKYDWKKNVTSIRCGTANFGEKIYSNNKGDYIDNIYYAFSNLISGSYCKIEYKQYFNIFDDLEVFFVFDNGYKTNIIKSDVPIGSEKITIGGDELEKITTESGFACITEVWIRTVD